MVDQVNGSGNVSSSGVSGGNPPATAAPVTGTAAQRGRITELPPLPARPKAPAPESTYLGTAVKSLSNAKESVAQRQRMLQHLVKQYTKEGLSVDSKIYIEDSLKAAFEGIKIDSSTPKDVRELRMEILKSIIQVDKKYVQEVSKKAAASIEALNSMRLTTDFDSVSFNNKVETSTVTDIINPAMDLIGRRRGERGVADLQSEHSIPGGDNGFYFGNQTRARIIEELKPFAEIF